MPKTTSAEEITHTPAGYSGKSCMAAPFTSGHHLAKYVQAHHRYRCLWLNQWWAWAPAVVLTSTCGWLLRTSRRTRTNQHTRPPYPTPPYPAQRLWLQSVCSSQPSSLLSGPMRQHLRLRCAVQSGPARTHQSVHRRHTYHQLCHLCKVAGRQPCSRDCNVARELHCCSDCRAHPHAHARGVGKRTGASPGRRVPQKGRHSCTHCVACCCPWCCRNPGRCPPQSSSCTHTHVAAVGSPVHPTGQ